MLEENPARTAANALQAVTQFCRELGLKVSLHKTKAMYMFDRADNACLSVDGTKIDWLTSYKYLGVHLDSNLTMKCQVRELIKRLRQYLSPVASAGVPRCPSRVSSLVAEIPSNRSKETRPPWTVLRSSRMLLSGAYRLPPFLQGLTACVLRQTSHHYPIE